MRKHDESGGKDGRGGEGKRVWMRSWKQDSIEDRVSRGKVDAEAGSQTRNGQEGSRERHQGENNE